MMEIIENTDAGIRSVRETHAQDVIPGSTRTDVENSAFSQTFRELFSRDYNPVALLQRHHELQKSKWEAARGRKPTFLQKVGLLLRGESPMQLIRNHYLDNFKEHLTRWEKDNVTAINCALRNLGVTRLSKSGGKTFRIIRSIERMIGNLKCPDGPDLGYESARASTYRYIFASPYDKRFAALTPEELCFHLKEAGVPETELKFQRYEDILSGQPTATLAMVSVNNGKAYVLRPQQPFVLTSAPDGTFPLEIDQHPQKNTPLQERKYSMPPAKTMRKKPGRKPKIHQ